MTVSPHAAETPSADELRARLEALQARISSLLVRL
jgi:hypothetical protein